MMTYKVYPVDKEVDCSKEEEEKEGEEAIGRNPFLLFAQIFTTFTHSHHHLWSSSTPAL